jgi:hypothetical protein
MSFDAGQMVRVSDPRSLTYGRIGQVLATEQGQSRIRFADDSGFVFPLSNISLKKVSGIPAAHLYLRVEVLVNINRDVAYSHWCVAVGNAKHSPEELAHAVVRSWYPGGAWNESDLCLVVEDLGLVVRAKKWKEISAAEYADLRAVAAIDDCTP